MYYPFWLVDLLASAVPAAIQVAGVLLALVLAGLELKRRVGKAWPDGLHLLLLLAVAVALRIFFFDSTIYEHSLYPDPTQRLPRVLLLASSISDLWPSHPLNAWKAASAVNVALGALSVPLLWVMVDRLFEQREVSWLAAWLLAGNPIHVKLSSGEAPVVSSLFLVLLLIVTFLVAIHEKRPWLQALAAAALLAMLPVQLLTRPLNVFDLGLLGLFGLAWFRQIKGSRVLTVAVVLAAGVVLFHLWALNSNMNVFRPEFSKDIGGGVVHAFFSEHNVLFNEEFVSWTGIAFAVVGVVVLAWRAPTRLTAIFAWYLVNMLLVAGTLGISAFANSKYLLQLLLPPLLVAAHSALVLPRRWGLPVAALLAISMPWQVRSYMGQEFDYQHEYRLVRWLVETLGPGDQVLEIPYQPTGQGARVAAMYSYWHRSGLGAASPPGPAFVTSIAALDRSKPAYFLCGIECNLLKQLGRGSSGEPYAQVFRELELTPVREEDLPLKVYDPMMSALTIEDFNTWWLKVRFSPEGQDLRMKLGVYRIAPAGLAAPREETLQKPARPPQPVEQIKPVPTQ